MTTTTWLFAITFAATVSGCVISGGPERPPPEQPQPRTDCCVRDSRPVPEGPQRLQNSCWAVKIIDPALAQCPKPKTDWGLVGSPTLDCEPERLEHPPGSPGKMFADGTKALTGLNPAPAGVLNNFCFYRWCKPSNPWPKDALACNDFTPEELDCPVVVPQAQPGPVLNNITAASEKKDAALAQAGALDTGKPSGTAPVVVAIVDTGSDHGGQANGQDHGGTLKELVGDVVCPGGDCKSFFPYRALALPLDASGEVHDPSGAEYGTRGHVAIGIVEAVARWKQLVANVTKGRQPVPRLVINLSLGWVSEHNELESCDSLSPAQDAPGDDTAQQKSDDPAGRRRPDGSAEALNEYIQNPPKKCFKGSNGARAVHAALLYASCHGALIVAAAGNKQFGETGGLPFKPAAWQQYEAPTARQCEALGFFPTGNTEVDRRVPVANPGPLLVAVSAVDYVEHDILATRYASVTALVAPGFHAGSKGTRNPLTGSSVSAAFVSAAAARLWSSEPGLSPSAVMEYLWKTGKSLNRKTPGGNDVRMLNVCEATSAPTAKCRVAPPFQGLRDKVYAAHEGDMASLTNSLSATWPSSNPPPSVQPVLDLAGPQPNTPICPDCVLADATATTNAALELSAEYQTANGFWLETGTIRVVAGREYSLDRGVLDALSSGARLLVALDGSGRGAQAEVAFRVCDGQSPSRTCFYRSSQLLVLRAAP